MTDIEAQRLSNLQHKAKLLADLNLHNETIPRVHVKRENEARHTSKRRKLENFDPPSRTSARIASSSTRPSYREDGGEKYNYIEGETKAKGSRVKKGINHVEIETDQRTIIPAADSESIRQGWAQWEPVGPPPTRDEFSVFHFQDYPSFLPNKSPEEMIREGSFGGSYWRPLKSRKLGIVVQDDWKELPDEWVSGLDIKKYLTNPEYDVDANKFKVACGQSIEEWEAAGWIAHEYDVRGWFQWYCRFFRGRRCDDDDRQVSRWRKCVGETGRWKRMLLKKYLTLGVREVFDDGEEEETTEVSPVMHQTCHHWAYEVRQQDLDNAWKR